MQVDYQRFADSTSSFSVQHSGIKALYMIQVVAMRSKPLTRVSPLALSAKASQLLLLLGAPVLLFPGYAHSAWAQTRMQSCD